MLYLLLFLLPHLVFSQTCDTPITIPSDGLQWFGNKCGCQDTFDGSFFTSPKKDLGYQYFNCPNGNSATGSPSYCKNYDSSSTVDSDCLCINESGWYLPPGSGDWRVCKSGQYCRANSQKSECSDKNF